MLTSFAGESMPPELVVRRVVGFNPRRVGRNSNAVNAPRPGFFSTRLGKALAGNCVLGIAVAAWLFVSDARHRAILNSARNGVDRFGWDSNFTATPKANCLRPSIVMLTASR